RLRRAVAVLRPGQGKLQRGQVVAALECAIGLIGQICEARRIDWWFLSCRRDFLRIGCWPRTFASIYILILRGCSGCAHKAHPGKEDCKNPAERHAFYSNRGAEVSSSVLASATIAAGSLPSANTAAPMATKSAPVFATSRTEAISLPASTMQGICIISDHHSPSPRLREWASGLLS